ncbi:unnamed protein product, partial [Owenia fusiformis]
PDCLNYMQNGSELIKVRSNSRQYHRLFTIDTALIEIRWQPSSKKPHKAKILVEQIKEVRSGKTTDILRNKDIAGIYPDECAFSIIFGDNFESLDLIANTPDEANIWVTGIMCLITGKNGNIVGTLEERQQMRDRWLQEMFSAATTLDDSGRMDEREVVNLMKKLNTGLTTVKVQQKIKELSMTPDKKRGRLSSEEFINLFKEMCTRPEIYFLLVRYSSSADMMSVEDLHLFLEAEQGMTRVTKEKCLEIIQKYEPSTEGKQNGYLGIDAFTSYLLSNECDIFDPIHRSVTQDMTQPLSHYFIASSHNTYLMEDQLKGPSSVEAYIRALRKGCRCIELDVWDGPDDGDPLIYHGHTLTGKIPFRTVIEAINEHAFATSQYPVILCLENHCGSKQQQFMAETLRKVLGNKLYTDDAASNETYLPSPEAFKCKILVKCKKISDIDGEEGYVTEEDEGSESSDQRKQRHKRVHIPEGSTRKIRMVRPLSDIVNYCKSVRFEDFHISAQNQKCNELCSFSESTAIRLAVAHPEEFVSHNKRYLSRVYPNGIRVDSSNFNPQDLWNCGCQLVSLNYQTAGLMMDLNDGRFRQNGRCGYVLKPAIMREEIAYFSANTRDIIPGVSPQILQIKVISGQQFPKPKGSSAKGDVTDPYVSIDLFGIPADCAEERTKTVPNNGYNPIYDESFEFQVNLPELALVRFCVLDDEFIGDEFIGQYTIPFTCMQTGYRHIQLMSYTGEPLENTTLFVHIAISSKYGSGKAKKGGSTSKKHKKSRDYTNVKIVGVKCIDETFKTAVQPLRDSTDLRDHVQIALAFFKEQCGLATNTNLKQCMRILSTRVHNSQEKPTLRLRETDEYPWLDIEGSVPEIIRRGMVAYESLIIGCKDLIQKADALHEKLIECQQQGLEWHEDLNNLCQNAGLKGKKIVKAHENFAWNIRVLKGQADLLLQAKNECQEYMTQVHDACISTGLVKNGNLINVNQSPPESPVTPDTPQEDIELFLPGVDGPKWPEHTSSLDTKTLESKTVETKSPDDKTVDSQSPETKSLNSQEQQTPPVHQRTDSCGSSVSNPTDSSELRRKSQQSADTQSPIKDDSKSNSATSISANSENDTDEADIQKDSNNVDGKETDTAISDSAKQGDSGTKINANNTKTENVDNNAMLKQSDAVPNSNAPSGAYVQKMTSPTKTTDSPKKSTPDLEKAINNEEDVGSMDSQHQQNGIISPEAQPQTETKHNNTEL